MSKKLKFKERLKGAFGFCMCPKCNKRACGTMQLKGGDKVVVDKYKMCAKHIAELLKAVTEGGTDD